VEEGLLNVNVVFLSKIILCLLIPRRFLFISNESAKRGFDRVLLATKDV
jgi:hypothetical protein